MLNAEWNKDRAMETTAGSDAGESLFKLAIDRSISPVKVLKIRSVQTTPP